MADIYLPDNIVCNSIAHNVAYNANYDIVWSFDFSLSGNPESQGSFTTFLFDGGVSLSGGGPGSGGAYYKSGNYLSGGNPLDNISLSGAILGINFDTTGLFAVGSDIVDGIGEPIPNSLTLRYGQTDFQFITCIALTSLYTNFNFLVNYQEFNRLKFRLTDIGQSLRIDYKIEDSFVEIANIPIKLNLNNNTFYKIGIGYTSPISGVNAKSAIFSIKNFHVEGKTELPEIDIIETENNSFAVYPVCALPAKEAPTDPTTIRNLSKIPEGTCPVQDNPGGPQGGICLANFYTLSGEDSADITGINLLYGSYVQKISATAINPPDPNPPFEIEECSEVVRSGSIIDGNNRFIVDFPTRYIAPIGPLTGIVDFNYSVSNQSAKFEVYYDGSKIIDKGYVFINNDTTYNLTRELALRSLTTGAITALSSNIESFIKTKTSPTTAEVLVYAPVDGTIYSFSVDCPRPIPETYQCGIVAEGKNIIPIANTTKNTYYEYKIILGATQGYVEFFYNIKDSIGRFIVKYDNNIVIDTGWVGSQNDPYVSILNNAYFPKIGADPIDPDLINSDYPARSLYFNKTTATTAMEVRVYSPIYNSSWIVSASCPGVYYPAYVPSYSVDDEIVVSFP